VNKHEVLFLLLLDNTLKSQRAHGASGYIRLDFSTASYIPTNFFPSTLALSTSFTTLSSSRGRRLFFHAAFRELIAIQLAARQFLIRHVSC